MEFKGFKIDFMALAALIGAVSGFVLQIKGITKRNKQKEGEVDEK